jgi:hypothetical protein
VADPNVVSGDHVPLQTHKQRIFQVNGRQGRKGERKERRAESQRLVNPETGSAVVAFLVCMHFARRFAVGVDCMIVFVYLLSCLGSLVTNSVLCSRIL